MNIDKLERKSTSGQDIINFLGYPVNVISYPDIYKYQSLDQLMTPNNACIILYEWKNGYGHWVCIFRNNDLVVQFFDPYSYIPDNEFQFIDTQFKNQHYPDTKYLSKLIYDSGYELDYNDHRLQNQKDHTISTCGLWIGVRLKYRGIPIDTFSKIFHEFPPFTPDQLVTMIFYSK